MDESPPAANTKSKQICSTGGFVAFARLWLTYEHSRAREPTLTMLHDWLRDQGA
jgi:hypothetical protein